MAFFNPNATFDDVEAYNATSFEDLMMVPENSSVGMSLSPSVSKGPRVWIIPVMSIHVPSLILNGVSLVIYIYNKKIFRYSRTFLLNLVVSDLLISISYIVYQIAFYYLGGIYLGSVYCLIFRPMTVFSYQLSFFSLMLVSLERYIAVFYPFRVDLLSNEKIKSAATIIVWIYLLLICVGPLPFAAFGPSDEVQGCVLLNLYSRSLFYLFAFNGIVANLTAVFLFLRVLRVAWRVRRVVAPQDLNSESAIAAKDRFTLVMGLVLLISVLAIAIFFVVLYFASEQRLAMAMAFSFTAMNGIANPVLQYATNSEVRKSFRMIFCPCYHE